MMYSKKNLDWLVPAFFGWNWLIEQIGVVPAVKVDLEVGKLDFF